MLSTHDLFGIGPQGSQAQRFGTNSNAGVVIPLIYSTQYFVISVAHPIGGHGDWQHEPLTHCAARVTQRENGTPVFKPHGLVAAGQIS